MPQPFRSSTYLRIFIRIISLLLAITVLVTLTNYILTSRMMRSQIYGFNENLVSLAAQDADAILENAEAIAFQMFGNYDVDILIHYPVELNSFSQIEQVRNVESLCALICSVNPSIHDIKVYSIKNKLMIGSAGSIMLTETEIDALTQLAKGSVRWENAWAELPYEGASSNAKYITPIYQAFTNLVCIIVIELDNTILGNEINRLYSMPSGVMFSLDANQRPILGETAANSIIAALMEEGWILSSGEAISNKVIRLENQDYYVTLKAAKNDWRYIAVVPLSNMLSALDIIQTITIAIFIGFLILSIAGSLLLSRGIYSPIQSICRFLVSLSDETLYSESTDEMDSIQKTLERMVDKLGNVRMQMSQMDIRLENTFGHIRRYFLMCLLNGDVNQKEEIEDNLAFLNLRANGYFTVIMIEFATNDQIVQPAVNATIMEGVIQVLEGVLHKEGFETIETIYNLSLTHQQIITIVRLDILEQVQERLKNACGYFLNIMNRQLDFSFTIGIGGSKKDFVDLSSSFQEAEKALRYQFVLGDNHVISRDVVKMSTSFHRDYYYARRHLQNSLFLNDSSSDIIENYFEKLLELNMSADTFSFVCKDFINLLYESLIEHNIFFGQILDEMDRAFIHFDEQFRSLDEVKQWSIDLIGRCTPIQMQSDCMSKPVIRALKIIEEEHTKDLSLSEVAMRLKISPEYLSRMFREKTGITFKNFLTKIKIDHAKLLLRESDYEIQKIALIVGYNMPSQFSTIFKKYMGVSPQEFRRNLSL